MRRYLAIFTVLLGLLIPALSVHGASAYADPAFQQQWQSGETITPNFWGPIATARDGRQEAYKEAVGGTRLVQYFDKGRMEINNGKVTNGLLAKEIVTGQVQIGDTAFQGQPPPAIAIAGDPDNSGPTYAQLATTAKSLFDAGPDHTGAYTQAAVSSTGAISVSDAGRSDAATFAVYDTTTKHNVPKSFADYRTKAGLQTIGYGISEPFMATVKVAGTQKPVMVQVFERRVLTYTASNDPAFQVEMGNIGQHYYQWRYPTGTQVGPTASAVTSPNPPSSLGQTFTDPSGRFTIQYPQSYNPEPKYATGKDSVLGLSGPFATIFTLSVPRVTISLDLEIAAISDIAQSTLPIGYQKISSDDLTIAGEPAKSFVATGHSADDTRPHTLCFVTVHHNGLEYSATVLSTRDATTVKSETVAIMSTLAFSDSPTSAVVSVPAPSAPIQTTATTSGVTFTSVQGAKPGNVASLTVQTSAGASCSISYSTPKGTSSVAAGLTTKNATSSGAVSWSWLIGGNTSPGTGSVSVTCDGATKTTGITIG